MLYYLCYLRVGKRERRVSSRTALAPKAMLACSRERQVGMKSTGSLCIQSALYIGVVNSSNLSPRVLLIFSIPNKI